MMSIKTSPLENSQRRAVGRPVGKLHLAVLQAAQDFRNECACSRGAILSELVDRTGERYSAVRQMVSSMKRRMKLDVVGLRTVENRPRPVFEYAPAGFLDSVIEVPPVHALDQRLSTWTR